MPEDTDLKIAVSEADHSRGPATAPVSLVEYGDYECPDCLNSEPMVAQLRERYGDRLRVIFRHFPKSSIHPRASAAAEAAEAAGAQDRFWEMHEALYKHQQKLIDLDFTHLALTLGLDVYRFSRDTSSPTFPKKVRDHYDGGVASGVKNTPTFFINGCRYNGEHALNAISQAIDAADRS